MVSGGAIHITQENLIRPAGHDDADGLWELARRSFPDSLLWQGPRGTAVSWLHHLMAAAFCEIWVDIFNGKLAGFVLLVSDAAEYAAQKKRYQLKNVPGLMLTCPILLSRRFFQRIFSRPRVLNYSDTAQKNGPMNSLAKTIWIELVAVSPEMRGRGLGKSILRFCEHRAAELGCDALKLNVFKNNIGAIEFYEKGGFSLLAQTKSSCIYTRNPAL